VSAPTAIASPIGALPEPSRLTVCYDESCALCRRARDWLLTQPCLVEVELLAAGSPEAARRYGSAPWLGHDLVVVDEHGNAWIGPGAFLACMWATARYRGWAFRLARPSMQPHAERFFRWISKRRDRLGRWVGRDDEESSWCEPAARRVDTAPVARFITCPKDHLMPADANYCTRCGSARPRDT